MTQVDCQQLWYTPLLRKPIFYGFSGYFSFLFTILVTTHDIIAISALIGGIIALFGTKGTKLHIRYGRI